MTQSFYFPFQKSLEHGARADPLPEEDWSALHYAAWGNPPEEALAMPLACGADMEAPSFNGQTPLSRAARMGSERFAKALIERGARPSSPDRSGRSPLDWAQRNQPAAFIAALLSFVEAREMQRAARWARALSREARL